MNKFNRLKYILAGSPRTTTAGLGRLARSARVNIRVRVAENRICPPEILSALSTDENPEVRAAVACNRSVPAEVLERLCADGHPDVRFRIASDATMPLELIARLTDDLNPFIEARALKTFGRIRKEIHEGFGRAAKLIRVSQDNRPALSNRFYAGQRRITNDV